MRYNYYDRKNIVVSLLLCVISTLLFRYLSYRGGLIATIIVGIYFWVINETDRYILLLMFLPFAAIFKIGESLPSSMIFLYLIIIISEAIKRRLNSKALFLLILIVIKETFSVIIFNASVVSVISLIINLLSSGIIISQIVSIPETMRRSVIDSAAIGFSLSMIADIILSIVFPNLTYMISYRKATALAYQNRFCALNADPNYYSQLVLVSIALLIAYNHRNKDKSIINRVYNVLAIGFLAYYGYISYSKSYIIAASLLLAIVVASFYFQKKVNTYKLIIGAFLLFLVAFGAGRFYDNVVLRVFQLRQNSAGLLTGRDVIWNEYLSLFYEKPLTWILGMGASNGMQIIQSGFAAHNAYIEVLGDLGIIGIILILMYYYSNGIRYRIRLFDLNYLFIIPFLVTAASLSLSSYDAVYMIIPLIGCVNIGKDTQGYESNMEENLKERYN